MTSGRVKKGASPPPLSERVHKDRQLPDGLMRFSFRHYQKTEKFCQPPNGDNPGYSEKLLERLRDISSFTVSDFRKNQSKALRAHRHNWDETTEPNGYAHLSEQLRQCEPWQFSLSANEHGRVHGILIDEVFYVVWLDPGHKLYEGNG